MKNLYRYFMIVYARVYFFTKGYRNGGLPCRHCVFVFEPDALGLQPMWMSCGNPEFGWYPNDGCNWGNM